MQHLTSAIVLALSATVLPPPASVSGRWSVTSNISGNTSQLDCMFEQDDAELTGTCESSQGQLAITGKVDGVKVAWQFDITWEGQPLTLYYAGALDADAKIVGTVDVQPVAASGDFTAVQTK
jgi:hypothetical protein